jgi:hypothetical protein
MPIYTLRRISTKEEWDVNCTFHELAPMLEDDDVIKVLSVPKIVTGVGNLNSKTDDGWKDTLSRIKKGAGRGNTINI